MTLSEIEARIEAIRAIAKVSDEMAHVQEKSLWEDALSAIADGRAENPEKCAALALTTASIDFERWFS